MPLQPSLHEFTHVVRSLRTTDEWSAALIDAPSPAPNSAERRAARQAFARLGVPGTRDCYDDNAAVKPVAFLTLRDGD